jgi:hypothetical protein
MFAPLAQAQYSVVVVADPTAVANEAQELTQWANSTSGHSDAYFVICGAPHGGRNHLSVQNAFNVLVFRKENNS